MNRIGAAIDTLLEVPVVPSFTRVGFAARSRLGDWTDLADYDATGRVVVLTGATSGIGRAAAERLAAAGASLIVIGRDPKRTTAVCDELSARHTTAARPVLADLGELAEVRRAADEILEEHSAIDALLHNAGALSSTRTTTSDGLESTVASQFVGPFLLTTRLLDALGEARGRVITMSSGGMYATGLAVETLQMTEDDYNGSEQYARAKRAQVTLNEMWPAHAGDRPVVFHALHPGWVDTPGVRASLPTFRRVLGPALRTADEGADTMVWLTLDDGEPLRTNGAFWLDRRQRSIHKLPSTRRRDTPDRRARLWDWVTHVAGS
jgi:dehydrogenase/reductase SDR family member 12